MQYFCCSLVFKHMGCYLGQTRLSIVHRDLKAALRLHDPTWA